MNNISNTRIPNYLLIIPLFIAVVIFFAYAYYFSPRSFELEGSCVKRSVGHGTYIVTNELDGAYSQLILTPIKSADYDTFETAGNRNCKDKNYLYNSNGILDKTIQ
jgi:hypothetical protein